MKEIQLDDEDQPCWACQLVGYEDTWSHARRKRRMAMRQEALKKQRTENIKSDNEPNTSEIDQLKAVDENDKNESSDEKTVEPLLVCTLLVGEKDENDKSSSEEYSEEDTNNKKMLRICMLYESGTGGKLSLETLRQYLVNKLNIREYFHKQHPSKPNKKKRKKKKNNINKTSLVC